MWGALRRCWRSAGDLVDAYSQISKTNRQIEQLEMRLLVLMGDLWYRRNRQKGTGHASK
jgi:hypothetical protein